MYCSGSFWVLNGFISSEAKTREDADSDSKLTTDLTTELGDRKSAISTEANTRSDADVVFDGKIIWLYINEFNKVRRYNGYKSKNLKILKFFDRITSLIEICILAFGMF